VNNETRFDRYFTDLELALIIEGLHYLGEAGKRFDIENVSEEDILAIANFEKDVPTRDITKEEHLVISELMSGFTHGFALINKLAQEEFLEASEQLLKEVEDYLRPD
jgi:hypothetical protein